MVLPWYYQWYYHGITNDIITIYMWAFKLVNKLTLNKINVYNIYNFHSCIVPKIIF